MKKCKFCGSVLPDGVAFCSTCGARVEDAPAYEAEFKVEASQAETTGTGTVRELKSGMLVWSIINTVLGFCTCVPFVLGAVGIIFTLLAKSAPSDREEQQNLRIAKVVNIITTALIAIVIIAFVSIVALAVAAGEYFYYFGY